MRDKPCGPDAVHKPWNLHPDSFVNQPHNCVVNAIHKSYTKEKRYGKSSKPNHRILQVPVISFLDIEQEFDKIALTHPPLESETPYDWRVIGITGNMSIQFCKTKPDLQLIIFHKGNKIYSLPSSERNKGQVSTLVLEPFGDHAMFRNDNKNGASKSNTNK